VFDWDQHNLKKIKAHRVKAAEVRTGLIAGTDLDLRATRRLRCDTCITAQPSEGRLLAIVVTERDDKIRVITAYDLDAGQKRDYRERRAREE
jgi:hypothetical protein